MKVFEDSLQEMNRMADECVRLNERLEDLEPQFKKAALQKARFMVGSVVVGIPLLLISLFWSGNPVMAVRAAVVVTTAAIYILPVHLFVTGRLRDDVRIFRSLDRQSLATAKRMAQTGIRMNRKLKRRLGVKRRH